MHAALRDADVRPAFEGVGLTSAPGTDRIAVIDAIEEALGVETILILDLAGSHATVERATRPQATALWAFTAVLAMVAALVGVQAVACHVAIGAAEDAPLVALGVGRRWRTPIGALEGAIIGAAGVAVAVVVAGILSSSFPIGKAALAEPEPGFALNLASLAAGAAALVLLAISGSALSAAWASSTAERSARSLSRVATAAASMGGDPGWCSGCAGPSKPAVVRSDQHLRRCAGNSGGGGAGAERSCCGAHRPRPAHLGAPPTSPDCSPHTERDVCPPPSLSGPSDGACFRSRPRLPTVEDAGHRQPRTRTTRPWIASSWLKIESTDT